MLIKLETWKEFIAKNTRILDLTFNIHTDRKFLFNKVKFICPVYNFTYHLLLAELAEWLAY